MNPYPAIEFTMNFTEPLGSTIQLSSWIPTLDNVNNINLKNGDTFFLYGEEALRLKGLIDQGNMPMTYKFGLPLTIDRLSSSSDWLSGNHIIQIQGTGFSQVTSVKFGTVDAQWFKVISDNIINTFAFPVATPQTVALTLATPERTASRQFEFKEKILTGTITKYAIAGTPTFIRSGADGNLWVTDTNNNTIHKVNLAGDITSYNIGTHTFFLCTGWDGFLYMTVQGTSNVIKVTLNGNLAQTFDLTDSNNWGICVGPDTNLWTADSFNFNSGINDGSARVLDPVTGQNAFYEIGSTPFETFPEDICQGLDRNLWVADDNGKFVWKVTTSGVTTKYTLTGPANIFMEPGICAGPDGNIWAGAAIFPGTSASRVFKIAPDGTNTAYTVTGALQNDICAGPDGNLWMAEVNAAIWKITTSGVVTKYPITGLNGSGICTGIDGNLWISDGNGNIVKFS